MNENYELEVSALLDNELSHPEVLALIDYLVEHEEVRPFYRRARTLQREIDRTELPPGLWTRIEERVASDDRDERTGGVVRHALGWPLKLAAIILCVVGIWQVNRVVSVTQRVQDDTVTVQLASNSGGMDEDRFIELTTELLRADRRYHRKMAEILNAVNADAIVDEGGAEGLTPLRDEDSGMLRAVHNDLDDRRERAPVWD